MAVVTRTITGEKLSKKECRRIEEKDKAMIRDAIDIDKMYGKNLINMRKSLPLLAEFGLYTVDEAIEIYKHIDAALKIMGNKDEDAVANRIADLSVSRIAKMVGGEVVEESET